MTKWERTEPTEEMKAVISFVRKQTRLDWSEGDQIEWSYTPDNSLWNLYEGLASVGNITAFRDPVYLGSSKIAALKFAVDDADELSYEFLFEPWTQTYLTQAD